MRGSAALRTGITPGGALAGPWVRNPLWTAARAVPSLDLRFAENKSLTDATTGQNLVTFTRASSGAYVDSQGVIRTATTNLVTWSQDFSQADWSKAASTVVTTAVASPIQGVNYQKIEATSANTTVGITSVAVTAATQQRAVSFFAQPLGNITRILVVIQGADARININLADGTFATNAAATGSTVSVSGQRFSISTPTLTNATGVRFFLKRTGETDTNTPTTIAIGEGLYLIGAQLEASSAVGEYIPTTSTINSAPRFDHNPTTGESLGLLVEEQRTNEVRNSNSMSAVVTGSPGTLPTNWSAQGNANGWTREVVGSGSLGSLNYVDVRFSGTPTGGQFAVTFQSQGVVAASNGQTWAVSVYHQLVGGSLGNVVGYPAANLWNSTPSYLGGLGLAGSIIPSATLQRYTSSGTISQASTAFINWGITFVCTAGNTYDFTIRFAGPQLELGAFSTSFVPTTGTTATRSADVASITGSNFGVSRTNLLVRSEEFNDATWTKQSSVSVSANTVISPNGTLTADTVTADSGLGIYQTITSVIGVNYSNSIYVKAGTATSIMFRDDTGAGRHIVFDPSTGVITSTSGTLVSFGSQAVGNGWYRYWMVYAADTTSVRGLVRPNSAGSAQTFVAWGSQLETGSAATAYIPTTSAAVTVVDSPWYRQDEGTVFGDYLERAFSQTHQVVSASNGTASERISMAINSSNVLDLGVISGGVDTFAGNTPTLINQPYKVGFAYRADNSGVSANGSAVTDDSAVILPTVSQLDIGARAGTTQILNSTIRRLVYFPQRLPNNVLQSITQ